MISLDVEQSPVLSVTDIHTFVVVDMRKSEAEADFKERREHPLLRLLHESWPNKTAEVWVSAASWLVHPRRQHKLSGNGNPGWRDGRAFVPLHHSKVMESQVSLTFVTFVWATWSSDRSNVTVSNSAIAEVRRYVSYNFIKFNVRVRVCVVETEICVCV